MAKFTKTDAIIEMLEVAGGLSALRNINGYPHENLSQIIYHVEAVVRGTTTIGIVTSIDPHTELGAPAVQLANAANAFLARDYEGATCVSISANNTLRDIANMRGIFAANNGYVKVG